MQEDVYIEMGLVRLTESRRNLTTKRSNAIFRPTVIQRPVYICRERRFSLLAWLLFGVFLLWLWLRHWQVGLSLRLATLLEDSGFLDELAEVAPVGVEHAGDLLGGDHLEGLEHDLIELCLVHLAVLLQQ